MEAMIRGYHLYATVWDAQIAGVYCARETGNIHPYAVAVKKLTSLLDTFL